MAGVKMKKIIALLIVLALGVTCLAGCGSNAAKSDSKAKATASQEKKAASEKKAKAEKKAASEKKAAAKSKKAAEEKAESSNSGSAEETAAVGSSSGSSGNSSGSTAKKKSGSTKEKTAAQNTCTVSINASELRSSSAADSSIKALVPADGMLLKTTTVKIESGDTVKSILLREAKKAGIAVSVQGSDYVQGIGGIFEKDAGSKSGWMYSLNGKFVQEACNAVKVKKGDKIKWLYTCDMGKDL